MSSNRNPSFSSSGFAKDTATTYSLTSASRQSSTSPPRQSDRNDPSNSTQALVPSTEPSSSSSAPPQPDRQSEQGPVVTMQTSSHPQPSDPQRSDSASKGTTLGQQSPSDTTTSMPMSRPSTVYSHRGISTNTSSISTTSDSQLEPSTPRTSSLSKLVAKAKSTLSRRPSDAESLPDNEVDFETQRAKAVKKEARRAEYERLGLEERTKFGHGAGGWSA